MLLDQVLASNSLTAEQAYGFIMTNLERPGVIYSAAAETGLTTGMLGDLVSRFDSSLSTVDVQAYFSQTGLDAGALDEAQPEQEILVDDPESAVDISYDDHGNLVIDPSGSLSNQQLIFLGGLIESKSWSSTFGDGDDAITESTPEGRLIQVAFGDQEYTDIVIDISNKDWELMNDLVDPLMDDIAFNAVQRAGTSHAERDKIYHDLNNGSLNQEQLETFSAYYGALQEQLTSALKPEYDLLIAGQSDLWNMT